MGEDVRNTYNQLAFDYEHNVDNQNIYNTDYDRPRMMEQLPRDMSGMKVLDAGCAAGWYTQQCIGRGAVVTAIDISPEMVAATKRRVGENTADVHCLDLDEGLPFKEGTFDIIVSSLTLHYIRDWHNVFRDFKRALKAGGKLLFSVHHPMMDVKLSSNGDYFQKEFIVDQWERNGKMIDVPFYRRPMQMIIADTLAFFTIKKLIEPQAMETMKEKNQKHYEKLMTTPHFLMIEAVKK